MRARGDAHFRRARGPAGSWRLGLRPPRAIVRRETESKRGVRTKRRMDAPQRARRRLAALLFSVVFFGAPPTALGDVEAEAPAVDPDAEAAIADPEAAEGTASPSGGAEDSNASRTFRTGSVEWTPLLDVRVRGEARAQPYGQPAAEHGEYFAITRFRAGLGARVGIVGARVEVQDARRYGVVPGRSPQAVSASTRATWRSSRPTAPPSASVDKSSRSATSAWSARSTGRCKRGASTPCASRGRRRTSRTSSSAR